MLQPGTTVSQPCPCSHLETPLSASSWTYVLLQATSHLLPSEQSLHLSPLSLPPPQPPPALPSENHQAQAQQKVPTYLQSKHLILPSPAHLGEVKAETSTSAWGWTLPVFSGSGDPASLPPSSSPPGKAR